MTARERWKTIYRRQRVAYRFFQRFRDRFVDASGELHLPSFFPLDFDPCRLFGDMLRDRPSKAGRSWSDMKLHHFRRPVRLPA